MTELNEEQVSDAFHGYLKSSLAQAKAERLLDAELLSSAEGDLMITGPALCLYFAALRSTTSPPSVPLPRSSTGKNGPQLDLSPENCPPAFRSFLSVWSRNVAPIQSRAPEYQHDLARVICDLPPIASPLDRGLARIAAELRAVAIEISQRRTFQDRYAGDLQAALDAGDGAPGLRTKASFVPPPMYDDTPTPVATNPPRPIPSPARPAAPLPPPPLPVLQRGPSASSTASVSSYPERETAADAAALTLIRETLYAALADALVSAPAVRALIRRDPPRAYFAAVALAVLEVALTRTRTGARVSSSGPEDAPSEDTDARVTVEGVLGHTLALPQCPPALRPFMRELAAIGARARAMQEADSARAAAALADGAADADLPRPRVERVRRMLERGTASEDESDPEDSPGGRSPRARRAPTPQGRALALANRINALALSLSKLRAFRERQADVFSVLACVGS